MLLLMISSKAYSQIVYTAVTPNFEIDLSPTSGAAADLYPIDFNNDGQVDFNFRWDVFTPGQYFMHITSSNQFSYNPGNRVIGTGNSNAFGVPYAMPLDYGTAIGASSTGWTTEQRGPLIGDGGNGNFLNLGDKYIGVRFIAGGQTYYGWILVSFVLNKLIIKSYAYQTNPSLGILAGHTGNLSVEDQNKNVVNSIRVYPNPAADFIKLSNLKGAAEYMIYNAEGKVVLRGNTNINTEISVAELTEGSYFLSVKQKNQPEVVKFIKVY